MYEPKDFAGCGIGMVLRCIYFIDLVVMKEKQAKASSDEEDQDEQSPVFCSPFRFLELFVSFLHCRCCCQRIFVQLIRNFRLASQLRHKLHLQCTDIHEAGFCLLYRFQSVLDCPEDVGVFCFELHDLGC